MMLGTVIGFGEGSNGTLPQLAVSPEHCYALERFLELMMSKSGRRLHRMFEENKLMNMLI